MCTFGKFGMAFIDIGEIGGCMSLFCYCGKSGQTNLTFFSMLLLVGVDLCMPGQHRVLPPLAAIIATKRRGMLAARSCRCSTGIFAHMSSRAGFPYW